MLAQEPPIVGQVESKTYPLGEKAEHPGSDHLLAIVALSHSTLEHRIYSVMVSIGPGDVAQAFTARRLMDLTGLRSLSTIRRGLDGLLAKLSIERQQKRNGSEREFGAVYVAFTPQQVLARRKERGISNGENGIGDGNHAFERAIARVSENKHLSRREAQVALCCVEGLTNAEIGHRLEVSEQTVKFHLRHVFVKFGVRRRAELISRLLM